MLLLKMASLCPACAYMCNGKIADDSFSHWRLLMFLISLIKKNRAVENWHDLFVYMETLIIFLASCLCFLVSQFSEFVSLQLPSPLLSPRLFFVDSLHALTLVYSNCLDWFGFLEILATLLFPLRVLLSLFHSRLVKSSQTRPQLPAASCR